MAAQPTQVLKGSVMPLATKYRLGNQPEEYELSEEFLGWTPEGVDSWEKFHDKLFPFSEKPPKKITLVNKDGKERVTLILHHYLLKDAFPSRLYGESRAVNWWNFLKVSKEEEPEKKFIIPMH